MANKAIKYGLYPTEEQAVFFAKTFGKQTPAMYKKEYPYLKEVDSLALTNVQLHLQQALQNRFQNKKKFGFPKMKSKKTARKSYTTNNQKGTIAIEGSYIKLPKVGKVKIKIHREPSADWELKSATISQDRDGKYYVSVLFSYESEKIYVEKASENAMGLDYKSDGLYMDSNGKKGDMPKYYRKNQKKLAKEQRRLSRKQGARKGEEKSNNYRKQQKKVAKIQKKTANQRKDTLHKKSTEIANQYDIVCVESLNMRAMSNKGFGNGKATLDNGYGLFLQMLEYKLSDRGKYLVKVSKWYPSTQLCSCCGKKKKLELEERIYECSCGMRMDRDYNAAINIKREGLRILREEAV